MARDRGSILFSLWGDDDWRELSIAAQHLYMQLLSSPSLSFAGVADWRPGKLALATDATASERYDAALELSSALFVVIDDDTEEILVRSFLRHDGLLKKPNVVIAMAKAYAAVASAGLRGVIVHELNRLRTEYPEWAAWNHASCMEDTRRILKGRSVDPKSLLISSVEGSVKGSGKGSKNDPSLQLPLQLHLPPSKEGEEPPSKCSSHVGVDNPPRCGACGDARRAHDAWARAQKQKATVPGIITDPDCVKHPNRPARDCDRCAEENQTIKESK